MATYGTDLVLLATGSDGEGGTWTEFSDWDSGGTPAAETENFIQGSQSQSQTFGNAVTGKSICFDAASDISASIPAGDVVLAWVFMGAPTNMYGFATGGHRFGIGASTTDFDMWYISGDDRPPNPYGGWWNVAVDPTHATDALDLGGTGSGGAWRFFGSIIGDDTLGIRVKISKGNPHAVDGMRMGRGEIYCTGADATFSGLAGENDDPARRYGLFQDTGGGSFLWKGLMSFGQAGTSTTFSDSNKSIVIDDTDKTYADFNKIEFNHVDTDVTLTSCSFAPRGTFAPGNLEMIDACAVALTSCSFNSMGTFTFLSGAVITDSTFNTCSGITQGSGIFDGCVFNSPLSASGIFANNIGLIDSCEFTSDGTGHAIVISEPGSYIFNANVFTGYGADDTSDAAIRNASNGLVSISVTNAENPTVSPTTGDSAVSVSNDVTLTVQVNDEAGVGVNLARVYILDTSDDSLVSEGATGGTGEFIDTFNFATEVTVEVRVRLIGFIPFVGGGTIDGNGLTVTVRFIEDTIVKDG